MLHVPHKNATIRAVLLISILVLLFTPASAWLTDYSYRQTINITGNESWTSDLTNYQIMFRVFNTTGTSSGNVMYTNGHTQIDWDDLRFTNSGDTLLDYWIESTNATAAIVWVEVDNIDNSTSVTQINGYYGNSGASAVSNGDNTFPFFDDFPGTSLNTDKWADETSGHYVISSGEITITADSATARKISGKTTFTQPYAMRCRIKTSHWADLTHQEIIGFVNATNAYGQLAYYSVYTPSISGKYNNYNGASNLTSIGGWSAGSYHIQDIIRNGTTGVIYKVDGSNTVSNTNNYYYTTGVPLFSVDVSGSSLSSNWVLVRKYTATEPTVSAWLSEECNPPPVASFTVNSQCGLYSPNSTTSTFWFTDNSTNATSWNWSFGDGSYSTSQNTSHTYTSPGTYPVVLTATNAFGSNVSTQSTPITVSLFNSNITGFINGSTSNLTNYQMKFVLWNTSGTSSGENVYLCSGTTQTDWDDIRFSTSNNTCIDYWIESTNATSAIVWAEIPFIAFGTTNLTEMRIFYGNSSVTNASDGDNTFPFFDDFPGSSLDTGKWTRHGTSYGSVSVTGGEITLSASGGSGEHHGIHSTTTPMTAGYTLEARSKNTAGMHDTVIGCADDPYATYPHGDANTDGFSWYARVGDVSTISYRSGANSVYGSEDNLGTAYKTYKIVWESSSSVKFYKDGTLDNTISSSSYIPSFNLPVYFSQDGYAKPSTLVVDWVLVRKYAATEPTVSAYYAPVCVTPPLASFTVNSQCGLYSPNSPNSTFWFTDTSTNTTSWNWSFGDGSYSTSQNTSHTYTSPGTYPVVLTATNAFGSNVSTQSTPITVSLFNSNITGFINGSTADLTNYQMKFILWNTSGTSSGENVYLCSGTTQVDWDDIRFATVNNTCMDYWIESTNATSAIVWAEIPFIAFGTTNLTEMRIFYGNSSVANVSDGDVTFPFFDDFPGSSLDGDKWPTQSGSISVSGGIATLGNTASDTAQGIKGGDYYGFGYILVFNASLSTTGSNAWPECSWTGAPNGVAAIDRYAADGTFHSWNHDGVYISDVSLGSGDSNYHIWEIARIDSTHLSVRKDRAGSWTSNNNRISTNTATVRFRPYQGSGSTNTININWVLVRKYAATEPTVSTYYAPVCVTPPISNFTSNITTGCCPLSVMFNDTTTNSPTNWSWDVDNDGNVDYTTQNCTHTYSGSGLYSVNLTTSNEAGSNTTIKVNYINVTGVTAAFSANVTSGVNPLTVHFYDNSTCTPDHWNWDVNGDDVVDYTTQNPSHTYSSIGTYTVKLYAYNACTGDWENKTSYITVGDVPVASFSADDTYGAAPHTVIFTGSATGSAPINYYWDVNNDGTFDYFIQSPTHVYSSAGIYTVKLFVNNSFGSDWENKSSYITVGNSPTASFTGAPTTGAVPLTVTFTDASTGDAPLSYAWDVNGDGAFDYYTQNPSHIYSSVGVYTVKLRVTNAFGVSWQNRTNYITTGNGPSASFTGAPRESDTIPVTVSFTDTSTNSPTAWYWDIDNDGLVDYTTQNCNHEYTVSGLYTVNLTVTNAFGSSTVIEPDYIKVGIPDANFYADPRWSENKPLEVNFNDISTNTPTSWNWDFGDGATSTEQNPTHEYTRAGTYSVVLTAENAVGDDVENKVAYVSVGELSPITPYDMIPVTPIPTTTFGVYATTLIESNYNVTTFGEVLPKAFTDIIDSDIAPQIFWGIVFAFVFIALFMRVGDVPLLVLFGLVAAGTILAFIPGEWQAIAQAFLVVGLAAIFYILIKGRFR